MRYKFVCESYDQLKKIEYAALELETLANVSCAYGNERMGDNLGRLADECLESVKRLRGLLVADIKQQIDQLDQPTFRA